MPGFRKKAIVAEKLVLDSVVEGNPFWSLNSKDDTVRLRAERSYLVKLRTGIEDISKGKGDYCIGTEGQELWFWWRINA